MNNEILPTDQDENDQKFAEIFGRLGRIECPPDFTVRTRARIAAARPQPRNSILMPVLRYSIPLSLILGIFAVFAVNRLTQPELASVEQIIVDRPVSTAASEPVIAPREAALAQNETTPVSEPPSIAAKRIEPVRPAESVQTSDEAGSIVRSLRGRRPSILPRGLDPTPGTETAPPRITTHRHFLRPALSVNRGRTAFWSLLLRRIAVLHAAACGPATSSNRSTANRSATRPHYRRLASFGPSRSDAAPNRSSYRSTSVS